MEKIYNQITEMINNSVKEQRELDKNYATELAKIIIGSEGLGINPKFVIDKKIIDIINKLNSCSQNKSSNEMYLYVTRLILKKLEYFKQYRNYKLGSENSTLQERILNMSTFGFSNFQQADTTKQRVRYSINSGYQLLAPENRFASIASYDTIMEVTEQLGLKNLTKNQMLELYNIFLRPYDFARTRAIYDKNHERDKNYVAELAPTIIYLKTLGYDNNDLDGIKGEGQNLDTIERLKLGLSLSDEEYSKLKDGQNKLERNLAKSNNLIKL